VVPNPWAKCLLNGRFAHDLRVGNRVLRTSNEHLTIRSATWRVIKFGMAAAFAGALSFGVVTTANANARTCNYLAAQLSGSGKSSGSGRYARAAQKQKSQIRKMQRLMRSSGCRAKRSLFRSDSNGRCGSFRYAG